MRSELIFIPVIGHMWLIFFLYIQLAKTKKKAVLAGLVDRKKAALDDTEWTDNVRQISNNIRNQFETPMLFYFITTALYLTDKVNALTLMLAGAYLISRIIHSYIHTTSNYVPNRLKAFAVGLLILLAYSIGLLIAIL